MSGWRDDPELVRKEDEDQVQIEQLEAGWRRVFSLVDQMVGEFHPLDPRGAAIKGFAMVARRRAAEDPQGTRATVVQAIQLAAAALELEPQEIYPELAPAGAGGSVG